MGFASASRDQPAQRPWRLHPDTLHETRPARAFRKFEDSFESHPRELSGLRADLVRAHARGRVPRLLRFDQVAEHPEFFDLEHRWDYAHLSQAGAERFTRLLAAEFSALAQEAQR